MTKAKAATTKKITRISVRDLVDRPGQYDQGVRSFAADTWNLSLTRDETLGPGVVVRSKNEDARSVFVPIANIKSIDSVDE